MPTKQNDEAKLIIDNSVDGTISLKLHYGDIMALLDLLNFAYSAAKLLSAQEGTKGTKGGEVKMLQLARDAKELHSILFKHLDIGEPDRNKVN